MPRVAAVGFSIALSAGGIALAADEVAPVPIEKQISTAKDLMLILGGGLVVLILVAVAVMVFRKAFGSSRIEELPSGPGDRSGPDPLVLAAAEERRGDYSAAAAHYDAGGDHLRAAGCWEKSKDFVRAAECWEAGGDLNRAAEMHVRSGGALRAAGIYMKTNNYMEAAKIFRNKGDHLRSAQALELYGNKLAAAREYSAAGNHAHAARLLEQERLYADAAEAFRPVLGGEVVTAAGADNFSTYAALLARAGAEERAAATYRGVLAVVPGHQRAAAGLRSLLARSPGDAMAAAALPAPQAPMHEGSTPEAAEFEHLEPEFLAPVELQSAPPSAEELARLIESDALLAGADPRHRVFTLRSMIQAGPMEPRYCMRLWVQVMRILAGHHRANVVFGCLTPDSIAIDMENNVRIEKPSACPPVYLSPEVQAGLPPNRQADIYSMGVLLYELVTGSLDQFGRKRAGELFSDVPGWLDELIGHCTEKNLTKRYRSTEEVSAALLQLKSAT